MKHEAEREIEDGADDDRDDVVSPSADRNRQEPGIGATLQT